MLRDTLLSQYASTHQIWNSYLKEYRRYALDRKRDGQTDGRMDKATTICLPQFLWEHKTVLSKKLSSWLPQIQCVYTVHHCIKPESPSHGRCYIVILTSKWMLRCSLKFNPQSVIRYQQFALWVKMSTRGKFVLLYYKIYCIFICLLPYFSAVLRDLVEVRTWRLLEVLGCL